MNKADLITAVSEETGSTKKDAEAAVKATLNSISKALANGDSVSLVDFGTFSVSKREARSGRNPRTGESISIPASNVPKFKAGKALKDSLN